MEFGYAPPPFAAATVGQVRALLDPVLALGGDYDWNDVATALDDSTAQLWLAVDGTIRAAGVTQIVHRCGAKWCHVWLIGGGELHRYAEWETIIAEAAKADGCIGMTISGRPGWGRMFPAYRPTAIVLERAFA